MNFLKSIVFGDFSFFIWASSILAVTALIFLYVKSLDKVKEQDERIKKLESSLDEMDEQARLIVKTDLELSQTQEELDRKITSLLALQRLSQALSSSLEEDLIFYNIREEIINELGFELCLVILRKGKSFSLKTSIGLKQKSLSKALLDLMGEGEFLRLLARERIIYPNNSSAAFERIGRYLKDELRLKSFIVSSIQSKEDMLGAVILGSFSEEEIFKGVRETTEILSNQIAQSLENISLFEQLYSSQQELEHKVNERTQDLKIALEEIRKVNRLKSEFVSAVSHELRTPLTSIKGYASLLVQEKFGKLPKEIKLRLDRINQQSDTLVNMINDLLDIARIESGRMKVDIQTIDASDIIKKVGDLLYPQMNQKKIELVLKIPDKLFVEADKKLLERIMINLLNNSIKFTPEGKKITVGVEEKKDHLRFNVKDEGIGIAAEDLENVFREFYKVDNSLNKEVKGTGLGLSLVKNIVKAHSGEVWVESRSGEGANFIFTLPLKRDKE